MISEECQRLVQNTGRWLCGVCVEVLVETRYNVLTVRNECARSVVVSGKHVKSEQVFCV